MVDASKTLVLVIVLLMPAGAASLGESEDRQNTLFDLDTAAEMVRVIVSFETHDAAERFIAKEPFFVAYEAKALPTLIIDVPPALIETLHERPGVLAVERDRVLPLHLDTSTQATRARAVWGDFLDGPLQHPETGEVIDGSGIGVAILDTGIDATHADLKQRVARNMEVVVGDAEQGLVEQVMGLSLGVGQPIVMTEGENTDEEGHGTHVSGTVAGEGNASASHKGVAPGASLYGIDVSHGPSVLLTQTVAAWDWILENHDQVDPPIRVVNNSYGCGANGYREDFISNRQVNQAVDEGIVVVYAVGNGDVMNDGGDGSDDRTSGCANNPRALGVASYNDEGTATRDGTVSSFSSRGLATDPSTWPDISAPGEQITAAAASQEPIALLSRGVDVFVDASFSGTFEIVIDGQSSGENAWYFGAPAAVYNAHEGSFVVEPRDPPLVENLPPFNVDAAAAGNMRFYGDVEEPAGPLHPVNASQVPVRPGDRIEFHYEGDLAKNVAVQMTSPEGRPAAANASFGECAPTCTASVDLNEHYPGAPADGTWSLSYGLPVDLVSDQYTSKSGTSMAAPHVTGVAALVLQADPSLTPKDVIDIMQTTAHKFADGAAYEPLPHRPYVNSSFDKGAGLVDAKAAVEAAFTWEPITQDPVEEPPEDPVEPIRTYTWEGNSLADSWPTTVPGRLQFDVRSDDLVVLAEMRWTGALGQGVDLVVTEPRECPLACSAEFWVAKDGDGVHRAEGSPFPGTQGAVRLRMDEAAVQGVGCDEPTCTWTAMPLPTLAVAVDYDLRVTVVNEGELPEDYTAFDD